MKSCEEHKVKDEQKLSQNMQDAASTED